ncbi:MULTISPECIES: protein kinase [unclassified Mesorhizobium]|uniref:protein kinase domain-containing protein n=1 Tax=unclassified Mesorhizobium TaxID=325217 RepID=UPI000FCABE13|nr:MULTISPECIES: protein kinase [unclassified Mesorhizobium]RUW29157.1 serine/threonine protein kinase [Mesorhizobium sp. M1E.F.Ca.ET.041.01.1.1]RUW75429.1 serine/threonine protein kinase [Mesorhizobium sp. M1E.F.Ca.ET.063.01.1.1]RWD87042.1 MAG: serine/threonine protein kinase [Mesorhizobium sp.]TIV49429.1 MAG: serine/threonine protein kinase [Mesorhizobium sp.]
MALLFSGRSENSAKETIVIPDELRTPFGKTYEVGERIAAGGNGVVHRCTDLGDGTEYAVKFLLDLRAHRRKRFDREKTLLQGIRHDHLIAYQDAGSIDGEQRRARLSPLIKDIPYIVMMLANEPLSSLVKRAPVPNEIFLAQFRGLAHGLGELHRRAVHRDIKPDNILVMGDRWVLSDYGLCDMFDLPAEERMTPDWEIVGPRFWMSPEANNRSIGRDDQINAASDVFQLASVFWFVVNRSHPTGVLSKADWKGPETLFDPIFKALHHSASIRPANGEAFAIQIDEAILG